jgi:hypothetical protein
MENKEDNLINSSHEYLMVEKVTSHALRLTNKHTQVSCPLSSLEPILDHELNPFINKPTYIYSVSFLPTLNMSNPKWLHWIPFSLGVVTTR